MCADLPDAARYLLVKKMGMVPAALRQAPPGIAGRYDNAWAAVEELASHLGRLPAGMLRFLADHPRGYLIVGDRTGYEPGDSEVQGKRRANVAHVSIADVAAPFPCLCVTAALVDHLLGCAGEPVGDWLSDGGGMDPRLVALGQQIGRLCALGYAVDDAARGSRRDYLAHSLAWYILDRRRLNVADPQIERLLKRSLMDERFWTGRPPPA